MRVSPRLTLVLLAMLLVIAAIFRFVGLDYAPSGGHGDVAWIGINALDWVDNGIWPFYVRELYSPEFFPVYATGLLLPLTGISYLPQRIITAVAGVLFVLFLYSATRWLLDDQPSDFRTTAGLFAAFGGAVSLHVIALNRLGMESPPFLTVIALLVWLTAWAWHRGGIIRWVLAGATLALAQYVFLAARLLPVVLAVWIVHTWWADRQRLLRSQWRGWLVMAGVSFMLTLPALILFVTTPEAFSARADTGTAETGGWIWQYDTSAYGGVLGLIVQKIGLTLLAFGIRWDGPYNIMNQPMLGPLFFVGLLVALPFTVRHFRRIGYAWPLLAIPIMLLTDLISGAVLEIHALHQMGILPFVFILSGIGLAHLWEFIRQRVTSTLLQYSLMAGIVAAGLIPAVVSFNYYLTVVIPGQYRDPLAGWQRAQTDVDLGRYLAEHSDRAFLLPHSEYNRADVAWVVADGFRYRRSAINASGLLDIPDAPEEITVVLTSDPQRPRHDGFPAHFDPRLWVLLYDNQVWLLPPLTPAQVDSLEAAHSQSSPEALSDQSETVIAEFYTLPSVESLFESRQVVDHELDATFNNEIRLVGYALPSQDLEPGSVTHFSLFWQPVTAPAEDYEVFVQLWNDEGRSTGGAHDFPYGGMYRTRIWQPDEIVVTHHWIEIPDGLVVGRYTLVAGLYRLLHNENLPVTGADADPALNIARAPQLRLAPSLPDSTGTPLPVTITYGDSLSVAGLDVSIDGSPVSGEQWYAGPGQTLTVEIIWEARQAFDSDYSLFLHLTQDVTQPPSTQTDAPVGGSLPTGVWRVGDVVRDRHVLQIPNDLPTGTYDILLGVYHWQTGERLAVQVDSEQITEDYFWLGKVVIAERGE